MEGPNKRNPAAGLADELIVEILRRLPVRSLCRFRCVSKSWRALISHRDHRKTLPQTLAGFFYTSFSADRCPMTARHFTNVSGRGLPLIYPSFSFLPKCEDILPLDCCNGLVLCRCWQSSSLGRDGPYYYAVCNPATEKWVVLPEADRAGEACVACLGFDPAVSHFHVFEFLEDEDEYLTGVEIYSSKTGGWSHRKSEWRNDTVLYAQRKSVFVNGVLHLVIIECDVVMVDTEGKKWRTIPTPYSDDFGFIDQSQGQLYFVNTHENIDFKLSIWVLEGYAADEWILKHSVSTLQLFGKKKFQLDWDYKVIAIHPECNLIFFTVGYWENKLMAYHMDRRELRFICILGHDFGGPYLSYVPFFSESLADGD